MSRPGEPLWETLLEAGLVQGDAPATDTIESPWYVKALLAFSGWLAAMFLLGFVGVGFRFIMESGLASLITGGVMMSAAYAVLRIPKNEFVEHLALAMSIAGQALAVWAFYEMLDTHGALLWALVALLQVLLALVMPNDVHRVWSSYAAAITFSMTLASMRAPYMAEGLVMLLTAWIWLNEFGYPHYMRRMRAVGYGLVIALIQLTGTLLFGHETLRWLAETSAVGEWVPPWVGEILAGAVMVYVVWKLLQRLGMRLAEPFAMATLLSTILFCGVSLEARGITAGMTIVLLGFAGGNRVLQGLGLASLLFYISSYYYLLETTLLFKSGTLLMVGAVLLAVRWLMLHVASRQKEAANG